jgi:hypothetical protein
VVELVGLALYWDLVVEEEGQAQQLRQGMAVLEALAVAAVGVAVDH